VLGTSLLVSSAVTCYTVLVRNRSIPLPRRVRGAEPLKSVWNSQMGFFLVSRLMMMTSVSSFSTYGLFFLRDVVEVSDPAQTLARMILAIGGALGVMVYLSGWISDQVGRKPVVVAGATGAALSTVWMLTAGDPTEVLLTATVIGASVGALLSANWAMANELADPEQAGLHIGIVNLSTIGGAGIAKLLGPGIDLLNHVSDDLGYRALIAGCAALFLAGAVLLLPVKGVRVTPPTPSG
jgi:MFS family permease